MSVWAIWAEKQPAELRTSLGHGNEIIPSLIESNLSEPKTGVYMGIVWKKLWVPPFWSKISKEPISVYWGQTW